MTNNSDNTLDELFGRIRSADDIITQEDIRSLVQQADISTTSIRAHRSLLSPKGLTMTGFILAGAAALVAYFSISEPTQTVHRQYQTAKSVVTSTTVDTASSLVEHPVSHTPSTTPVFTPTLEIEKQKEPVSIYAPMTIPAEKIEKVSDEQMHKLGIIKEDNGDIIYSMDGPTSAIRWRIPAKGWGIILNTADTGVGSSTGLEPLVITDVRGNKRIVRLKTENESIQLHRYNSVDDENGIKSWTTNDDVDIRGGDSMKVRSRSMFIQKSINTADSSYHIAIDDNPEIQIHMMMRRLDSLGIKNGMKELRLNLENMRKDLKSLRDGIDTAFHRQINIKMRINDSTDQKDIFNMEDMQVDIEKKFKDAQIILEKKIQDADLNFQSRINDLNSKIAVTINRLVPVLVREATTTTRNEKEGIDYDDGVIFWYEPSDDLSKALDKTDPTLSVPSATAPIFSSVIAYPNPARDKTTLQFRLSEPRTVVWSIHEISGRMASSGKSVAAGSGENSIEIDVTSLTSGVYMLALTTDKDERSVQRIIIER